MNSTFRNVISSTISILLLLIGYSISVRAGELNQKIYLPIIQSPSPWQEVGAGSAGGGGISNHPRHSSHPSLALAPNGTPYVAWEEEVSGNDSGEIFVLAWNGSMWAEVGTGSASGGGISNTAGWSETPSLAFAPDGTPYVAWDDHSNGNEEIYVRVWNGSSWAEVGAGSASGGGISKTTASSWNPSLAVAPNGTPYVAWSDYNSSGGNHEIYVRVWNGSSWVEVGAGSASGGGISNNVGYSYSPSLAVAPNGTPYLAWSNGNGENREIYVRVWNGSVWAEVGVGSASGGGISNTAEASYRPSLAIASDGTPYVAWEDYSNGNGEIYVRAWNGSSWAEVGVGSANGGGISNSSGQSWHSTMALALDGTPYVAWSDDSSGKDEIYVRAWNGSSWAEVGIGSASGGGISDSAGYSYSASLAVAPDGTPYAAWQDDSGGNAEIYIRRFIE